MRILARRVQFVLMMRVLDGADAVPQVCKMRNQFCDQCRFATVFSADDMDSFDH